MRISLSLIDTCNPFSPELDPDKLIALHTGVAVKNEVAEKILTMEETGKKWMDAFIEECKANPKRFEERIPRTKVNVILYNEIYNLFFRAI